MSVDSVDAQPVRTTALRKACARRRGPFEFFFAIISVFLEKKRDYPPGVYRPRGTLCCDNCEVPDFALRFNRDAVLKEMEIFLSRHIDLEIADRIIAPFRRSGGDVL